VCWWIESYIDTRCLFDKVNTTLQHVLDEEGIHIPFLTQMLNLQVDPETAVNLSQAIGKDKDEKSK